MKAKKILSLLLATALTLSLCACGKKNNNYSDLEKLLDNGQYDAAITLIQQYKTEASKEPVSKAEIAAEDQAYLDTIVGEYTFINPYSDYSDYAKVLKVNSDMTVTLDDVTYPFEIRTDQNGRYISYKKPNANGDTWNEFFTFEIDEETGYVTTWLYHRLDQLTPAAKEEWSKLVGNYVYKYKNSENAKTVSVGEDFTLTIDGEVMPVNYKYDTYNDPKQKEIVFMYQPQELSGGYRTLSYSIDDDGFVTLMYDYCKEDQIEYINIDSNNLYDYFEWTGPEIGNISKNAFDEPSYIYITNYLALKDEYIDTILSGLSYIALEATYTEVVYKEAAVTFNAADSSFVIDKGEASKESYYTEDKTTTLSYLSTKGDYDKDSNYIVEKMYIASTDICGNLTSDYATKNGDVYTFTTWYYAGIAESELRIDRSATVLAFRNVK